MRSTTPASMNRSNEKFLLNSELLILVHSIKLKNKIEQERREKEANESSERQEEPPQISEEPVVRSCDTPGYEAGCMSTPHNTTEKEIVEPLKSTNEILRLTKPTKCRNKIEIKDGRLSQSEIYGEKSTYFLDSDSGH